ncbi:hypothetical protein FRB99_007536 [Tulasnella sp. 403]|nr:hypothetical protein FRB99_007536 [Tulasnella sp. 403]
MASTKPERRLRRATPNTILGKVLLTYHGWYNCPGDGQPLYQGHHGWHKWFEHPLTEGGHPRFDLYPDVESYAPQEVYGVPGLSLPAGEPAKLFSSRNRTTVTRHFRTMAEHGVDGVFAMRIASECEVDQDPRSPLANLMRIADEVLQSVRQAAEAEGRVWAIMYDLSGVAPNRLARVIEGDWGHLVIHNRILSSPNYLREAGRPVIGIKGLGFQGTYQNPAVVVDIMRKLRTFTQGGAYILAGGESHIAVRCARVWRAHLAFLSPRTPERGPLMCKVSPDWRANVDFMAVYREADAISPWMVGHVHTEEDVDFSAVADVREDVKEIRKWNQESTGQRRVDYIPVAFPGLSRSNLYHGAPFNEIPRKSGRFLWRQIYYYQREGAHAIIGESFDDFNSKDENQASGSGSSSAGYGAGGSSSAAGGSSSYNPAPEASMSCGPQQPMRSGTVDFDNLQPAPPPYSLVDETPSDVTPAATNTTPSGPSAPAPAPTVTQVQPATPAPAPTQAPAPAPQPTSRPIASELPYSSNVATPNAYARPASQPQQPNVTSPSPHTTLYSAASTPLPPSQPAPGPNAVNRPMQLNASPTQMATGLPPIENLSLGSRPNQYGNQPPAGPAPVPSPGIGAHGRTSISQPTSPYVPPQQLHHPSSQYGGQPSVSSTPSPRPGAHGRPSVSQATSPYTPQQQQSSNSGYSQPWSSPSTPGTFPSIRPGEIFPSGAFPGSPGAPSSNPSSPPPPTSPPASSSAPYGTRPPQQPLSPPPGSSYGPVNRPPPQAEPGFIMSMGPGDVGGFASPALIRQQSGRIPAGGGGPPAPPPAHPQRLGSSPAPPAGHGVGPSSYGPATFQLPTIPSQGGSRPASPPSRPYGDTRPSNSGGGFPGFAAQQPVGMPGGYPPAPSSQPSSSFSSTFPPTSPPPPQPPSSYSNPSTPGSFPPTNSGPYVGAGFPSTTGYAGPGAPPPPPVGVPGGLPGRQDSASSWTSTASNTMPVTPGGSNAHGQAPAHRPFEMPIPQAILQPARNALDKYAGEERRKRLEKGLDSAMATGSKWLKGFQK